MSDRQSIPRHFICVRKVQSKNVLFRVLQNGESWTALRWSNAGYWTQNGGGQITPAEANLYFQGGRDVLVVSCKDNPTPPRN